MRPDASCYIVFALLPFRRPLSTSATDNYGLPTNARYVRESSLHCLTSQESFVRSYEVVMSHEDFAAALPPPVRGSPAVYVAKEDQSEEDKQWMREALLMAEEAFEALEVPVGSVFVRHGKIIAKGRNRTNELMNVSRCCCYTNATAAARRSAYPLLPPRRRLRDMRNWKQSMRSSQSTLLSLSISLSIRITARTILSRTPRCT